MFSSILFIVLILVFVGIKLQLDGKKMQQHDKEHEEFIQHETQIAEKVRNRLSKYSK